MSIHLFLNEDLSITVKGCSDDVANALLPHLERVGWPWGCNNMSAHDYCYNWGNQSDKAPGIGPVLGLLASCNNNKVIDQNLSGVVSVFTEYRDNNLSESWGTKEGAKVFDKFIDMLHCA